MRTHNKPCTKTSRLSTGTSERQYSCDQCRICLEDGEIPIFGENDISIDIAEFGQIKIEIDENLPMFICENCMSLLKGAILFRKTAKLSEEVLNKHRHEASLKSEDFGRKNEEENDIKTEYLEFDYSSDSNIEIADFECKKEFYNEDSTSQNHTISEEQESEDIKDFCIETDNFDESIVEKNEKEIDNEMIMIIVSDKDKPKLEKKGGQIDIDDGPESELSEQPTQKGNPKECEVCLEMVPHFKYEDHLQEHRKKYVDTCNKRNAKVECKHCGKCVSKTYIKLHMRILHGTPEEQAERQIKCELCDRSFNRNYYADHVKRVHGSTNKNIDQKQSKCIECPVCYKEIKESKYEAHVAWHGGRLKQLICDKCGKVFKHPSAFKTHCLTHGSELKYKCQFCPYRGLHQALLKIHVRTHTGDYNYKCTECPARFITKSNLSKHLQRHKAPSNFKCEVCGRCFYSKRDLDKHAKCVHMSLKTHVCDICGKGFGHRDNLLSHQLKTHKKDKTGRKGRMPSYLKVDLQNVEQC